MSKLKCVVVFMINTLVMRLEYFGRARLIMRRHQMETFSTLLVVCAGISPVTGEFPSQSQWRGALMFSLICVWTNGWANNRDAGDLRRHRAHYDVTVVEGKFVISCMWCQAMCERLCTPQGVEKGILWKRIGVMVCKKAAYPNCSGALTNCSGRLITVPEDL